MTVKVLTKSRIAYKVVLLSKNNTTRRGLAKLEIPKGNTLVCQDGQHKNRTESAKVLSIQRIEVYDKKVETEYGHYFISETTRVVGSQLSIRTGYSICRRKLKLKRSQEFTYRVGKTTKVKKLNKSDKVTCAQGIHVFLTKKEALEYYVW